MWEMLDPDLECGNECGGPGPPPEFRIPPPPRPPFLADLDNCNEDGPVTAMLGPGSPFNDGDMCQAIPILDASFHSSPSFQTSAMIVLCSVLLLIVIFISSLLVWKHKRKVQNFLPCKTPTRGPPHHLDATGVSAAHSVTYEDPDVHLGHHPLVLRHHHHHHHHNMELHHPKQIHYPSGYPMPRSPPLFICSSPGPDPYRSHDNVYEELEHPRDTDSEPPVQSDDDFAEDELSLPGDRSFHKSSSDGGTTVATIYHDRSASSNAGTTSGSNTDQYMERNRTERNSLLSSSSSNNDNNLRTAGAAGGSSSGNNNRNSNSSTDCASSASGSNVNNSSNNATTSNKANNNQTCGGSSSNATTNCSGGTGLFRSRKQPLTLGSGRGNKHFNNPLTSAQSPSEMRLMPTGYEERAMMTLPPSYQTAAAATGTGTPNNLNNINNNSFLNSNSLNNNGSRSNYYSTIDDECDPVERRNRINAQLSASSATIQNGGPSVSTIFRNGRPPYPGGNNNNHHNHHTSSGSNRSRTNPRSLDRRRYINNNSSSSNNNNNNSSNLAVISTQDPSQYIYHEPVFHEGLIYDACLSYSDRSSGGSAGPPYPYVLPHFTTFRTHGGNGSAASHQAIYSRDSSFGSDSGYSQHTQASNRSTGWNRNRLTPQQQIHQPPAPPSRSEPPQAVADS
ncbi:transcription factor mef2A [Wyeomyia smithii]|uniref:transcription factor mef2A n=1 Tax=Wyeomyia smithii TaxID=174621 RepID=UPI002467FCFD|nr:transcription factor mef2A [Wyeomyia smithii]XP_055544900.1 transcription factor mef2A [Wyeomyia smithii]